MIMRDERCAETIERLLDDLDGLLQSRKAGDRDSNLAENAEEKVGWENCVARTILFRRNKE